jgi:hypothetical protein
VVTQDPPRPFGAVVRQFDPAEVAYAYPKVPKAPNWAIPVGATKEQRSPIWDQGMVGSCTSSIVEAIETMATIQGRPWPHLSHEDVYWRGRARDNFFGEPPGTDTGAYIASVADEALLGICTEDVWPYDGAAWEGEDQHPEAAADRMHQDWLTGHHAIYPGPGADIQIYDALSRGCMVLLGWFLTGEMYDPGGRPYPKGLIRDPHGRHGVHASFITRYFRDFAGTPQLVIQQSWGEQLNAGIERLFPDECRSGEVVAPLEWATRQDGPAFEFRVLDLEPYTRPQLSAAEIVRQRKEAMYALERQYYEQGSWYEGDQCWWAGVQLGYAEDDIVSRGATISRRTEMSPRPTHGGEP